MSDNVMITPLFHQRSHSMPVGRAFINGNPVITHGNGVVVEGGAPRTFDYKRSSPLKQEATTSSSNQPTSSDGFPLPIPKSLTSQFRSSPLNQSAAANHHNDSAAAQHDHATAADDEDEDPAFFCQPKNLLTLFDYHKKTGNCPIILNCKMDRGFFVAQSHWTCYRRNYFQVTASLTIPGHSDKTYYALQLESPSSATESRPIQQFFLRLKAYTSNSSHLPEPSNESSSNTKATVRPVALTQMTPKRDKGPQREPPTIPITPSDSVFGNEQVCVTFERLQFRVATANNGKRRASQQYFRLIFELVAQLDDASQHVVTECYSSPLVVRGRSPGHYSSEPQRDVRKKRRLTPSSPPPPPLQPPATAASKKQTKKEASCSPKKLHTAASRAVYTDTTPPTPPSAVSVPVPQQQQHYQHVVTLPPPQYVYNPPSLVVDTQRQSSNENTSSSSSVPTSANSPVSYHAHQHHQQQQPQQQQQLMPHLMSSAFNSIHARSQSANDSEMYVRHRQGFKYQSMVNHHHQQQQQGQQQSAMFDNYSEANIERALRDWQQQVHRQRTDSAATFDSYMSASNEHDNRSSTRPDTPIPYHSQQQQHYYSQPPNSNWSPAAAAAAAAHPPPLDRHHYEDKYHQQQQQELSPKLYQQSR
ncbi:unnamed protein product [Mucor fragilis]